jgi:hypothetical protein
MRSTPKEELYLNYLRIRLLKQLKILDAYALERKEITCHIKEIYFTE